MMKNVSSELKIDPDASFRVPEANLELAERLQRLKSAVKRAGGNKAVSESSGLPLSNIGAYMAGREMKVPALIALSKACDVNIAWLASGEGPMNGAPIQAQSQTMEPQKTAEDRPFKAFATIKVDLMAEALEAAQKTFTDAGAVPETRQLVQVTLLYYDMLNKT